jgi:hypothetical protein
MSRTAHSKARLKFLAGGTACSAFLLGMLKLDFLGFQQCKTNAGTQQYSIALNPKRAFPSNGKNVI